MRAGHSRALAFPLAAQLSTGLITGCTGADLPGLTGSTSPFASIGYGTEIDAAPDKGNDSFETAYAFPLTVSEPQAVAARIDPSTDVDVYELGTLFRGDRLILEVTGEAGLDAAVAVFDADGNLMYLNDDRNYFAGQLDPLIDFIVRRDSTTSYAVVASSPDARGAGGYTLATVVFPGVDVPPPHPQTVLLNFDGTDAVSFAGRPPVSVPVFDAASISPELQGRSDELIQLILRHVRADYAGLDVDVITSRDGGYAGADVTTIHFGAYDRALLGVAENIDEFNERAEQQGIIFTDTFQVFNVLEPTLEEYAQALANVTSHEIGHLLGLVHTADTTEIMDITASLRQLMRDQTFALAPLERMTFPMGYQDASVSLFESVGGDLEAFRAYNTSRRAAAAAKVMLESERSDRFDDLPRPAFSRCMCRTCEVSRLKRRAAADNAG